MKHKYALIAALAAAPLLMPTEALAERCKQYTKTIRIGGQLEVGVGQACETRNGDWEIVSLKGPREIQTRLRDHIYDDLDDRGYRVIVVNNYGYPPHHYAPRHYDTRVAYYQPRPAYFGFYFGGHESSHNYKKHNKKYSGHNNNHGNNHGKSKGHGHKKHH